MIICFPDLYLGSSVTKDTLSDFLHTLTQESYFPVDVDKATIKALDAFSRHGDAYTRFLGPEDYKDLLTTTAGGYYGVGLELAPKKEDAEHLVILKVLPEGPAYKAGVKIYDKIIAIDGTAVGSLSTEECLKKLRGEKQYAPVTLTIMRNAKILTLSIKRDSLSMNSTWSAYLPEQKIAYCHIQLFNQQTPLHLRNTLEKGLKKKPFGIIIDLRNNGGGSLQAAVECAALFLPRTSLVAYTKNRHGVILRNYVTSTSPMITQALPIFILVNQFTASAAEILAKSLSIYSRTASKENGISPYIFLVGTHTFGKGSVQDVVPIGVDCALKLTTALYYLSDNTSIQDAAVKPDFIVKQRYPASKELKELHTLYGPEKAPSKRKNSSQLLDYESLTLKALTKDHQVLSALDFIQLVHLGITISPTSVATHSKALAWITNNSAFSHKLTAESL